MANRFIVENWNTCETIAVFDSEEERQNWLDNNVTIRDGAGYMADGVRVSIYET
jgi:hypothetical protein